MTKESFSKSEIEIVLPSSGGHTIRGIRYIRGGNDNNNHDKDRDTVKNEDQDENISHYNRWIFLHGWLDNAASFDYLIPSLFGLQEKEKASDFVVDDVVAIDMSGHGKSDHRNNAYHIVDFVADTLQCADSLFGGSNVPFNILGHSLGAAVALLVAGTARHRIQRLVMIDILGPLTSGDPTEGPSMLAKSCQKIPSGSSSTFRSIKEAAVKRAEKNVVKDDFFTPEVAEVVCSRGLRPISSTTVGDGSGNHNNEDGITFTWSADSWLLVPTRLHLSNSVVSAFASSCTAQTLIILAEDGMLNRFFRLVRPIMTIVDFGRMLQSTLFLLAIKILLFGLLSPLLFFCRILFCHNDNKKEDRCHKLSTIQKGLQFVSMGLERVGLIKEKTFIVLPAGGHHLHLTTPNAVATEIQKWIVTT